MSALDLNLGIALSLPFTTDSFALEFDCDDSFDAWAVLHRGAPEVDGPNNALIHFVDDDVEVCVSLAPPTMQRPKYHAFGDPLDCAGSFNWQLGEQVVLGDFGGFTAIGPITIDSLYIGYRRSGQTGWMLLSFDVQGGLNPVSLHVHQLLPLCPGTMAVGEATSASSIALFPNPGNGADIRIESAVPLRSIELLDATGRLVAHHDGGVRMIPSPTMAGIYLLRVMHVDGRMSFVRFVRS